MSSWIKMSPPRRTDWCTLKCGLVVLLFLCDIFLLWYVLFQLRMFRTCYLNCRITFHTLGMDHWTCLVSYRWVKFFAVSYVVFATWGCISNFPSRDTNQAQKTAELLLDLKLKTIVSSTKIASAETANTICRVWSSKCYVEYTNLFPLLYLCDWITWQVQEAADCLGADCVPRYVEMKQIQDLDVGQILKKSKQVRALPFMRKLASELCFVIESDSACNLL